MKWVFIILGVLTLVGDGRDIRNQTDNQLILAVLQLVLALAPIRSCSMASHL